MLVTFLWFILELHKTKSYCTVLIVTPTTLTSSHFSPRGIQPLQRDVTELTHFPPLAPLSKTDRGKFLRPEINQNNVLDVSNALAERGGKEIYVLSFIIREVSAPSTAIINILPRRKAIAQATGLEKGSAWWNEGRWKGRSIKRTDPEFNEELRCR